VLRNGDVVTLVPRIKGGSRQGRFGHGTLYSNSHGSSGT
jgi:hypothetical protein